MPRFWVPSTHPWTVSAAIKTKWSLNILLPIVYFCLYGRGWIFAFQECLCFGWLGWEIKCKTHHIFHVCFQSSIKCEKIICCGELGTTSSKKLANLGLSLFTTAGANLGRGCRRCAPPLRWSFRLCIYVLAFKFFLPHRQWRHSLEVHRLLRKILDPPLMFAINQILY